MLKLFKSPILAVGGAATAIVLVAGGGAVAGSMVGSPQIKDDSIRSIDIKDGAVQGKDLRKGVTNSITKRARTSWVKRNFAEKGAVAGDGAPGVTNYETIGRGSDAMPVPANTTVTLTSKCGPDEVVVSGGVKGEGFTVNQSFPSSITEVTDPDNRPESDPSGVWTGTEWTVVVTGDDAGGTAQPFLICTNLK